MAKFDYRQEVFSKVSVCGIGCELNDMRIDRDSVPEGKCLYEVAGDDESGGDPARVQQGILVNFFGTLICDKPLPIGNDGGLWLMDGDFICNECSQPVMPISDYTPTDEYLECGGRKYKKN